MGKQSLLESQYGREFHKGFMSDFKGDINGMKIMGSIFQRSGTPDYIYYGKSYVFGAGFIGIEMKYVPLKKVPKTIDLNFTKLLSPKQKRILKEINEYCQLGLQVTLVQVATRRRVAVITRPRAEQADLEICPITLETSDDGRYITTTCVRYILLNREPGEVYYDYSLMKNIELEI